MVKSSPGFLLCCSSSTIIQHIQKVKSTHRRLVFLLRQTAHDSISICIVVCSREMRKLFCCLDNRYFLEVGMVARARTASRDALPKKEGASINAVKLPLIKPNLFSKDATNWFPRDDIRLLAGAYKVVFLLLEIISSGSVSDGPKWNSFRKKKIIYHTQILDFLFSKPEWAEINIKILTQSKVCSSSGNYLWPDRNIFFVK